MAVKAEYANIKVRFGSYYKYQFTFVNDEGYEVSVGGISDEIYRADIKADTEYTIEEVFDKCGGSLWIFYKGQLIDRNI